MHAWRSWIWLMSTTFKWRAHTPCLYNCMHLHQNLHREQPACWSLYDMTLLHTASSLQSLHHHCHYWSATWINLNNSIPPSHAIAYRCMELKHISTQFNYTVNVLPAIIMMLLKLQVYMARNSIQFSHIRSSEGGWLTTAICCLLLW